MRSAIPLSFCYSAPACRIYFCQPPESSRKRASISSAAWLASLSIMRLVVDFNLALSVVIGGVHVTDSLRAPKLLDVFYW